MISFVICTYNRSELLARCLKSLSKQISESGRQNIEVLVVDNNSSDGTALVVMQISKVYPRVRYVFEPVQGLSFARNRGALEARGKYIGYLDDDAVPGEDYINSLFNIIESHAPDILGGPVFPFYTSRKPFWFQDQLEVRQHSTESGFIDCPVSGGNFVIRRALLLTLGLFSCDYGMRGGQLRLGEERHLIERYRSTTSPEDRKIYYSQECFVYHHVPVEKMRIGYFVRRAFESGRMKAQLKNEARVKRRCVSNVTVAKSRSLIRIVRNKNDIHLTIRVLHRAALISGMIYYYVNQMAGSIVLDRK